MNSFDLRKLHFSPCYFRSKFEPRETISQQHVLLLVCSYLPSYGFSLSLSLSVQCVCVCVCVQCVYTHTHTHTRTHSGKFLRQKAQNVLNILIYWLTQVIINLLCKNKPQKRRFYKVMFEKIITLSGLHNWSSWLLPWMLRQTNGVIT